MNYGTFLMLMIGIIGISLLIIPIYIIPSHVFKDKQSIIKYLFTMVIIMILCLFSIASLRSKILNDLYENNITCKKVISDMNILESNTRYIYHDDNRNIIYAVNNKDNKVITINNNYKYIQYILVDNKQDIHVEKCILSSNNIKPITFDCYRLYLTKDLMNEFKK